MDNILASLCFGVLAALIATFINWFIRRVWQKIIVPWLEERIYQDVHFEGIWDATDTYSDRDSTTEAKYSMEFLRKGHNVNVTSTCTDGDYKGRVYLMEGSFKNLVLILTWTPQDKRSLERGTLAAKLIEDGTKFVGHGVTYSETSGEMRPFAFEAVRRSL